MPRETQHVERPSGWTTVVSESEDNTDTVRFWVRATDPEPEALSDTSVEEEPASSGAR